MFNRILVVAAIKTGVRLTRICHNSWGDREQYLIRWVKRRRARTKSALQLTASADWCSPDLDGCLKRRPRFCAVWDTSISRTRSIVWGSFCEDPLLGSSPFSTDDGEWRPRKQFNLRRGQCLRPGFLQ